MLKVGIIGLGHGSRVLTDAFRLNNIEVHGVTSRNFSKAKKISKEKKITKAYKSWKDLINDKKISIIAIAVPPYLQLDILKECIKKNKIIFCEKPIGIDIEEINKFFLNVKKNDKFFFVDYIFAEHEIFKQYYKLLNKQIINKNDYVKIFFNTKTYINDKKITNWKSFINKGGGIVNQFLPHIIDYLIWFFGRIKEVNCNIIKKNNREITANCFIKFQSNIKANILVNTNNKKQSHLIEYNSQKYQISLRNSGLDYAKNFKINYTKFGKNNTSKTIEISCKNDKLSNFKMDGRILLSSMIIGKLKKSVSKNFKKINLKRFQYNEYVLHCIRKSVKEKRLIKVL